MIRMRIAAAAAALLVTTGLTANAASAAETIEVPFTTPSTATTNTYSGVIRLTVSGTGFSQGSRLNDAFYFVPEGTVEASGYYQFGFGTAPLTPFTPGNAIGSRAIGGRPAYSPTNTYTFLLDTGSTTPTQLYFGVTDGQYADNGGTFSVTVAAIPEPASWAMMIGGFGLVGGALRQRKVRARITFA